MDNSEASKTDVEPATKRCDQIFVMVFNDSENYFSSILITSPQSYYHAAH